MSFHERHSAHLRDCASGLRPSGWRDRFVPYLHLEQRTLQRLAAAGFAGKLRLASGKEAGKVARRLVGRLGGPTGRDEGMLCALGAGDVVGLRVEEACTYAEPGQIAHWEAGLEHDRDGLGRRLEGPGLLAYANRLASAFGLERFERAPEPWPANHEAGGPPEPGAWRREFEKGWREVSGKRGFAPEPPEGAYHREPRELLRFGVADALAPLCDETWRDWRAFHGVQLLAADEDGKQVEVERVHAAQRLVRAAPRLASRHVDALRPGAYARASLVSEHVRVAWYHSLPPPMRAKLQNLYFVWGPSTAQVARERRAVEGAGRSLLRACLAATSLPPPKKPRSRFDWPRDIWPSSANAAYSASRNTVFVSPGLLAWPFLSEPMGSDEVRDWGGLARVLSHEVAHAFDADGLHWDSKGAWQETPAWCGAPARRLREARETARLAAGGSDALVNETLADLQGMLVLRAHRPRFDWQAVLERFSHMHVTPEDDEHDARDEHAGPGVRVNAVAVAVLGAQPRPDLIWWH